MKRISMIIVIASLLLGPSLGFKGAVASATTTGVVSHKPYMNGTDTGLFMPDTALTRAEAAQLLFRLFDVERPMSGNAFDFSDVSETTWYYEAVSSLFNAGIIEADGEESIEADSEGSFAADGKRFAPEASITRVVFIFWINRAADRTVGFETDAHAVDEPSEFSDITEDLWCFDLVTQTSARGWITGFPDGTFRPDASLSRAEAAVILNRVLDRFPDHESIRANENVRLFPDLTTEHWAYDHIIEATVGHSFVSENRTELWTSVTPEVSALSPGPHTIGEELYYILDNGMFARNTAVGNLTFGNDGRYTSGSEELDGLVKESLSVFVKKEMTQSERLWAAFDYMVDGTFSYISRPHIDFGEKDWEVPRAVQMLQLRRGNCYSFAAAFCVLARQLGYDADIVSGYVSRKGRDHGWVEITAGDGSVTCYDTTFETGYRSQGLSYNLFGFTYENASFTYIK